MARPAGFVSPFDKEYWRLRPQKIPARKPLIRIIGQNACNRIASAEHARRTPPNLSFATMPSTPRSLFACILLATLRNIWPPGLLMLP